ncbi:hypothetical protein AB0N05_09160 [Nocardia sp. NPDC051030]|uniref:hypothetical protein n=1 Tax=Nocardia sp. NPDC051030 TaxID=3155162 RepID=UPI003419DDF8
MRVPVTAVSDASARAWLGAVMIVAVCGAGGCGSEKAGYPVSAETTTARAVTTARTTTPSTTTTTTTTVTVPATLPPATDGTNLDACADGNCEIQVDGPTAIPVVNYPGVKNLQVQQISENAITLTATTGSMNMTATSGPGGTITLNGLVVNVIAIKDGSAVLHVSTP